MIMQVIMFTVMNQLVVLDVNPTSYETVEECEQGVQGVYVSGHGYVKDRWSLEAYCFKTVEDLQ